MFTPPFIALSRDSSSGSEPFTARRSILGIPTTTGSVDGSVDVGTTRNEAVSARLKMT